MVKFSSSVLDKMNGKQNEECTNWIEVLTLDKQVTELNNRNVNEVYDQSDKRSEHANKPQKQKKLII